ncbi:MAG: helix-turn-helix domain-containing protein, partial [Pseudomonadota bacterium]
RAVLASTYRHLHALVKQIEELKGNSGLERVARYIRASVDLDHGETEMVIPFDKKTLASALGIKPESLSRAFRRLEDHGVRVEKRKIIVTDAHALENFLNRK